MTLDLQDSGLALAEHRLVKPLKPLSRLDHIRGDVRAEAAEMALADDDGEVDECVLESGESVVDVQGDSISRSGIENPPQSEQDVTAQSWNVRPASRLTLELESMQSLAWTAPFTPTLPVPSGLLAVTDPRRVVSLSPSGHLRR